MAQDDFDIHAFLAQEAAMEMELKEQKFGEQSNNFSLDGLPSFYRTVWPLAAPIPKGWLDQNLQFDLNEKENGSRIGIEQPVNGPCGVLAVVQGMIFSERLTEHKEIDISHAVSQQEICHALAIILGLHAKNSILSMALWKNKDQTGREIELQSVNVNDLESFLLKNIDSFTKRGCLPLILYSIVATKGEESIKNDFKDGMSGPSLVESTTRPDVWFCSSDLMTLLLYGNADGNLAAFNRDGTKRVLNKDTLPIGMLSRQERETKIAVLDEFKHPKVPVWILHSGDHFTTFAQVSLKDEHQFVLFNGLPPGGPKTTLIEMHFSPVSIAKPITGSIQKTDFVPLPGEIYDIVQAHPDDKKATPDFSKWRFEVVLAQEDPTVKGPERPKDMHVDIFQLCEKPKGRWRCAKCYFGRHQTFCFGENKPENDGEATSNVCKFCEKTKDEAQWTIWMKFDELPLRWKGSVNFNYAPKLVSILNTRWTDGRIIKPDVENVPTV